MKTTFVTVCVDHDEPSGITHITMRSVKEIGLTECVEFQLAPHLHPERRKALIQNSMGKIGYAILKQAFPQDFRE